MKKLIVNSSLFIVHRLIIVSIILFILLAITYYLLPLTKADEHGGDSGPYVCSAPNNLSCEEFQTAVGLNWINSMPAGQYNISWTDGSSATCPAGSPTTKCGSTTINTTSSNNRIGQPVDSLISGLTQGKNYTFTIRQSDSYCEQSNINSISCRPGICGDGFKNKAEACDGTDFGGLTCGPYGYNAPQRQLFEGGNLNCTSSCQISTSTCTGCNTFSTQTSPVTISTAPKSGSVTTPGSVFKCFVEAARAGPCITCQISYFYSPTQGTTLLNPPQKCTFKSWNGTKAEFDCIAPSSQPSGTYYTLTANYPSSNDPNSSGNANCNYCTYDPHTQTVTGQPRQVGTAQLRVINSETTPPTVTIQESWQSDLNNLSKYKNVTVEAICNDGTSGSGCNSSTIKMQKFTTKPTACPTTYSTYTLNSPQPTASTIIWYCAAAKDNYDNIGFSQPFELRPGCRDQCTYPNARCDPNAQFYNAKQTCTNIDADMCYEWSAPEGCAGRYSCSNGTCDGGGLAANGGGNVWQDVNGNGVKDAEDNKGIEGMRISYSSSYEGGGVETNGDGSFVMIAEKHNSFTIKPIVPPLWKLTKTTCEYYTPNPTCSTRLANDATQGMTDGTCYLGLGFNVQYGRNSEYCNTYPTLSYGLTRVNQTDTAPTFQTNSPSLLTSNPTEGLPTKIEAKATDDQALRWIEIYLNGALTKRCIVSLQQGNPVTSGTCTYEGNLTQGNYSYYAIAIDDLGKKTTSETKTFVVRATPVANGCYQPNQPRAGGLISVGTASNPIEGKFGNAIDGQGICALDSNAAFVPFKIPDFDSLKSIYFDQSKLPREGANQQLFKLGDNPSSPIDLNSKDKTYFVDGDLIIDNPADISGNQTGVIFVKGNLEIGPLPSNKLQHGTNTSGLVFVVKEDVIIDPSITVIDAVIISEGFIYTAGADCTTNSVTAQALTINGSLISLGQIEGKEPIQFCRTLSGASNATSAAEVINHQIKYLPILRDLFSSTYQKWSEVSSSQIVMPPPVATPITTPTPAPTATPTATPTPAPKRVFVTSTKYVGIQQGDGLMGTTGADAKCQARADAVNLGGAWKAWISDSSTAAKDRISHSPSGYKLLNNTVIADSWEDLISVSSSNQLTQAINITETGAQISSGMEVWTATASDGSSRDKHCRNWMSTDRVGDSAYIGAANLKDEGWTAAPTFGVPLCGTYARLYCFEQ